MCPNIKTSCETLRREKPTVRNIFLKNTKTLNLSEMFSFVEQLPKKLLQELDTRAMM